MISSAIRFQSKSCFSKQALSDGPDQAIFLGSSEAVRENKDMEERFRQENDWSDRR
jgi:hypothetical protein